MSHKVTLIPGEGIGPEVAAAAQRVIDASGAKIEWEEIHARASEGSEKGQLLNKAVIESVKRNRVALKGPMATAIAAVRPASTSPAQDARPLRQLAPSENVPGVQSRFENVDVVLVRENTEDLYSGLEHEVVPGVVESLKIITEKASTAHRTLRF